MNAADRFIDTNVLLYLLSGDVAKADRAEAELASGGIISVQVLNEFASVASRKLKMSIAEIRGFIDVIRAVCTVVDVSTATHDRGLDVAEKYKLSIYDAMIIAAALLAGCKIVLSEDVQHNQKFEKLLSVRNPFYKLR